MIASQILKHLETESNKHDPPLLITESKHLLQYIQAVRKRKYGNGVINLGELADWCIEHAYDENLSIDEPFVVDYNAFFEEDDPAERVGDYEVDTKTGKLLDQFRFFLTTRRLLEFSMNSTMLHTDGTYKLN